MRKPYLWGQFMELNKFQRTNKVSFKHLISLENATENDIYEILSFAKELKDMRSVLENVKVLNNKYVLLITKPSILGTEIAFQIAVKELGGTPVINSLSGEVLENCLQDEEYIKTLSTYGISMIAVSTSKISDSSTLERFTSLPVINSNNENSPCTALSALLTAIERKKDLKNKKVVIVGNLNVEDYSLMIGFCKLGANVTLLPTNADDINSDALSYASQFSEIKIEKNKRIALKDADFIYALKNGENEKIYINEEDLSICENAYILSSLPVDKSIISKSLIHSEKSLIFNQSENLLHVGKAILSLVIGKNI